MIPQNLQALAGEAIEGIAKLLPDDGQQLRNSVESLIKEQLESRLLEMNLVSKKEFQAHNQLLNRLKDRVIALEEKIERLEQTQSGG